MANASSFSGDSSTFINNNDEIKILIESKEEELEQNTDEMKTMIESVEEKRKDISPFRSHYDIYQVSRHIYKQNPDAYRPQTVSILNHLLIHSEKSFESCVDALRHRDLEEKARKCYSDTMNLGKVEFAKMMVMDSCFILQFLDSWRFGRNDHHFVSNKSWGTGILIDLIKIENQLPLFVLERLHGLLFDHDFSFVPYIYDSLIMPIAKELNGSIHVSDEKKVTLIRQDGGAKHFLDLLRRILIPCPRDEIPPSNERDLQLACNATELKSAGVKFQKKENASNLFDINFEKGVLTIPTIVLSDHTEVILRNLIAFEQENLRTSQYFTSYAAFMDDLIDTTKDVTLLMQKGIIINWLGSPEDAATLFNKIVKHVVIWDTHLFSGVIKDLNEYSNNPWNKRVANLRQTYFNSPWAGISVSAAVFVIFLTIIQTICSLLQFKK